MDLYVGLSRQTSPGSPQPRHCSVARSSRGPGWSYTVCVTLRDPRALSPQTGHPPGGSEAQATAGVPSPCARVQGGRLSWLGQACRPLRFLSSPLCDSFSGQLAASGVWSSLYPTPSLCLLCSPCMWVLGRLEAAEAPGSGVPIPTHSHLFPQASLGLTSLCLWGLRLSGWNQQTGWTVAAQWNPEWAHTCHPCLCSGRTAPCV